MSAQLWLPSVDRARVMDFGALGAFLDAPRRRRVRASLQLLLSVAGRCKRRRPDLPAGWNRRCTVVLVAPREERAARRRGRIALDPWAPEGAVIRRPWQRADPDVSRVCAFGPTRRGRKVCTRDFVARCVS